MPVSNLSFVHPQGSNQHGGAYYRGSTRFLMNTSGGVVQSYAYHAYGTLIAFNGVPATAYLYTGEQWDGNLGMYYLRARYYKPDLGRFWTMDSYEGNSRDPLSLHKYLYAANNPVNMVDPSGHMNVGDVMFATSFHVATFAARAVPYIKGLDCDEYPPGTSTQVTIEALDRALISKCGDCLTEPGFGF